MAITALYENSATISTTEYSLTLNAATPPIATKTDDGIFQCFLDLSAMVDGDQFALKVYEKVQSAGTQRLIDHRILTGVQAFPHTVLPSLILMHGWDITLTKISATDRAIAWSIRQIS